MKQVIVLPLDWIINYTFVYMQKVYLIHFLLRSIINIWLPHISQSISMYSSDQIENRSKPIINVLFIRLLHTYVQSSHPILQIRFSVPYLCIYTKGIEVYSMGLFLALPTGIMMGSHWIGRDGWENRREISQDITLLKKMIKRPIMKEMN